MMRARTLSIVALTTTTALVLTGCGAASSSAPSAGVTTSPPVATGAAAMPSATMAPGSQGPSPEVSQATAPSHEAADVAFATNMISHHRQAVTMAAMAATAATSPVVKTLAAQIKAAQSPEITEMSGWLTSWGAEVPAEGMDMGMTGMAMPGLMTGAQMKQLQATNGAAFDKLWLQMMISHHQGAIAMARTEVTTGASPDAKKLAQSILTSQQAQITTMTQLLGG